MGGMAAQIPIKDDPAANTAALAKVRDGVGGGRAGVTAEGLINQPHGWSAAWHRGYIINL